MPKPYTFLLKHSLCLLLLIIFTIQVFGQRPTPGTMQEDCFALERECDIEGFDRGEIFELPQPYTSVDCKGQTIENPLWWQFVAGQGELTFIATKIECVPDIFSSPGIVITVWENCPGFVTECVASSPCPNGGGFIPQFEAELTLQDGELIPGGTYYVSVAGCEANICQYRLEIIGNNYELPDLTDPDNSLSTEACLGGLPPNTYCVGNQIYIEAEGDELFDSANGVWEWSIRELDMNANADVVSWQGNWNNGIGNPIVNGGTFKFNFGTNGLFLDFPVAGKYEICLESIGTNCGAALGPLCQEIDIIPPPELQVFDVFDICYSTLFDGSWDGPPLPNSMGQNWIAGSIFLSDLDDNNLDDDDNYIVRKTSTVDRCGCSYEQEVRINLVGDEDPGEVELSLIECQLPYTWFDITIFELDEYIETPIVLRNASLEKDFENVQCDSFIVLTIVETELNAEIVETNCTPEGKEYTFVTDEDIEIQGADYQWINADTGLDATEVSEDPSAILPSGNYFVYVTGFIEDVNHNDNSQGTTPLSYISCPFGPFEVFNPVPEIPQLVPYDEALCPEEQFNVVFEIDSVVDSLMLQYYWLIPESILGQEVYGPDSTSITILDIRGLEEGDSIRVYSIQECATSDTLSFTVSFGINPNAPEYEPRIACLEEALDISYIYSPDNNYDWQFPGAEIVGNTNDGSTFQVIYSEEGTYEYFVTITTLDGCETLAGPFIIEVFETPTVPNVTCMEENEGTSIIFEWDEDSSFEYEVVLNTMGVTGNLSEGSYVFDNLEADTEISITVSAINNGPEECNTQSTTLSCSTSPCDLPDIDLGNFTDRVFCQGQFGVNSIQFNIMPPSGITGVYVGPGINTAGFLDLTDPIFDTPGEYFYEYRYSEDATGCEDMATITILIQPAIIVDIISNYDLCDGESLELSPVVSGGDGGPFNYNWSNGSTDPSITIPEVGNEAPGTYNIDLEITDNTSVCIENRTIVYTVLDSQPVISELIFTCNDNGTDEDFDDDFYDVFINALFIDASNAGQFSVSVGGEELATFDYNTGGSFTVPADGNLATVVVQDLSYAMCINETEIGPLTPCEPECDIQTSSVVSCDDNDTADPSDDFYQVKVVTFVSNPGPSGMFALYADGEFIDNFMYVDGALFEYPAVGLVELYLEDLDKPECSTTTTVNLTSCSFERFDCEIEAFDGIPLYGPFTSRFVTRDDVALAAQSYDHGMNEKVSKLSIVVAGSNAKQLCNLDSAEYRVSFYEDAQGLPGSTSGEFTSYAIPDSVGEWSFNGTDYTFYKLSIELGDVFTQGAGWFSVEGLDQDCPFIWMTGDNAPNNSAATRDTNDIWSLAKGFNYCFFFDPVNTFNPAFDNLSIYPNPTNDLLFIDNIEGISRMEVYDIHGKAYYSKVNLGYNEQINTNEWPAAMYILQMTDDQGQQKVFKIFKQ